MLYKFKEDDGFHADEYDDEAENDGPNVVGQDALTRLQEKIPWTRIIMEEPEKGTVVTESDVGCRTFSQSGGGLSIVPTVLIFSNVRQNAMRKRNHHHAPHSVYRAGWPDVFSTGQGDPTDKPPDSPNIPDSDIIVHHMQSDTRAMTHPTLRYYAYDKMCRAGALGKSNYHLKEAAENVAKFGDNLRKGAKMAVMDAVIARTEPIPGSKGAKKENLKRLDAMINQIESETLHKTKSGQHAGQIPAIWQTRSSAPTK